LARTLRLRIPARTLRVARRALRSQRRVRSRIRVTAADPAGHTSAATRTVRVVR